MKEWPTKPQQRTHREGAKENKGRKAKTTRRVEARRKGRKNTATCSTARTTGSTLVGARFRMRFTFDGQQDTAADTGEGRGTQQGREGDKHTPGLGNDQGQPWKGSKKQKAKSERHRKARKADNRSGDGGEGTNGTLQTWNKNTRDLTQTNQPEGPMGINASQTFCKVFESHVTGNCAILQARVNVLFLSRVPPQGGFSQLMYSAKLDRWIKIIQNHHETCSRFSVSVTHLQQNSSVERRFRQKRKLKDLPSQFLPFPQNFH